MIFFIIITFGLCILKPSSNRSLYIFTLVQKVKHRVYKIHAWEPTEKNMASHEIRDPEETMCTQVEYFARKSNLPKVNQNVNQECAAHH